MSGRTLEPDEGRQLARGEGRARSFRFDQETTFHAAVNRAHDARALVPESAEPRGLARRPLHGTLERSRLARGDGPRERSYERLVSEHDRRRQAPGRDRGTGVVSFDIVSRGRRGPPLPLRGAGGCRSERRAPARSGPDQRRSGAGPSWNLVPASPPAGRRARAEDDLIFEMQGRRIEGTLFVASAKPPIEPFDVLVSVDGRAGRALRRPRLTSCDTPIGPSRAEEDARRSRESNGRYQHRGGITR